MKKAITLILTLGFAPLLVQANTCTIAFESNRFELAAATPVEVSTDCTTTFVDPPEPEPEPEPTPPPLANAYATFFDGSSGLQGRVQLQANGWSNPANFGAGDFTITVWMKAENSNQGRGVQSGPYKDFYRGNIWLDKSTHRTSSDPYAPGIGSSLDRGRVVFYIRGDGHQYQLIGNTDVRDGEYHHIALVRDDTRLSIYIDGRLDASVNGVASGNYQLRSSFNYPNDPYLVLGQEKHGFNTPAFTGGLYDFCIASRALYTTPFTPGPAAGCDALHWRLDQASGAVDLTGQGNDGALVRNNDGYPQLIQDAPF